MSVINVKVKNIRPKYKNLEEWMKEPNNVYIGRGGVVFIDGKRFPKENSKFANPYKIGQDGTREEVIDKYKKYIENKIFTEKTFKNDLLELKNKILGCWCKPDFCHGDILLELIDKYSKHPIHLIFEDKCCICKNDCNELSGWKCNICDKVFCDEHNDENYTCDC